MDATKNRSSLVLGTLLIVAGVLIILGQVFGYDRWWNQWPLIVVGVGVAFFIGMALGGRPLSGLAIPGSIITTVGLILWEQNTFNNYETWSYAWALIIAAVGFGLIVMGKQNDQRDQVQAGVRTLKTGLVLFLVFGALMEFIFSIGGVPHSRANLLFPGLLALLGLWSLVSHILAVVRRDDRPAEDRDLFWPALVTGLGILWTLTALNLLPVQQVSALLNLWPLLLIAGGLDLAFGRRSPWIGLVLGLLLVAVMFALITYGPRLGLNQTPAWMIGGANFSGGGLITQRVEGSGTITTETRPADGFDQIELSAGGAAEVIVGDSQGITVTADDNLMPYILTEVRNGKLSIRVKDGTSISPSKGIQYVINVRNLSQVEVSGTGEVRMAGLTGERLSLYSSGMARFELKDLQLNRMDINISGSGAAILGGSAERLTVEISGSGNLEAGDLKVQQADINISGAGQAVVWVLDALDAHISGAGNVSYYGSPATVQKELSGAGSVTKKGDK